MRTQLIAAGLAFAAGVAAAQSPGGDGHASVTKPSQIAWAPAPASLPAGAKVAVLEGKLSEPGPFTMRAAFPDGYRLPPHFHPGIEHVTVLKGTFRIGMGEKFDAAKLSDLPAGTFVAMAPGTRHFAQAKGETIVQVHGVGPWGITYVDPADDPRRATP